MAKAPSPPPSKRPKGGSRRSPINVDLSKLAKQLILAVPTEDDLDRFVAGLAAAARTQWVKLAQQEVLTTRQDYVAGIQEPTPPKDGRSEITLLGQLPNMVEQGWAAHDLRETVIPNAKTKKTSKDGYVYVRVPFRHGAPTSGGGPPRNGGRPMPKPIHNEAKKLAPTVSRPAAIESDQKGKPATLWGERLTADRQGIGAKAKAILQSKQKEWHSTSIYTGMVRKEKTYQNATQSSYSTWRTISTKPGADPRSWQHPGIKARHLAVKVSDYIGKIAQGQLDQALKSSPPKK